MGYAVKPDGTIVVDSLDEAIALSQRMQAGAASAATAAPAAPAAAPTVPAAAPAASAKGPAPRNGSEPAGDWKEFLAALKPQQRPLLTLVKTQGKATMEELTQAAGGNAFTASGLLTGIKRIAKKTLGSDAQLLRRESKGYGPSRVLAYKAGPLLQANNLE